MIDLILSPIISFILTFFGLKYLIISLKKHKKFQPIRVEGPESHVLTKSKTPTMGGLVLTCSILVNILLFCDLTSPYIQIMLILMITFSIVGLLDDVIKVFFNNTKGFAGAKKLVIQLLISSACILYLLHYNPDYMNYQIYLPIFNCELNFCLLIAPLYVIILCGSSNASNITDGLDGLLSLPVILIAITFSIIIGLIFGGYNFSAINIDTKLLHQLLIVLFSVIATFACFLIYNHHPAKIFMGDVGSLMIGVLFCYIAILLKVEILYGIMSILFIIEIMSSVLQVFYYKITHGKRIFKMAPYHHHLEKCGWSEKKIVRSMWLFTLICCVISLILFFL